MCTQNQNSENGSSLRILGAERLRRSVTLFVPPTLLLVAIDGQDEITFSLRRISVSVHHLESNFTLVEILKKGRRTAVLVG